jgi:hypothetical protein
MEYYYYYNIARSFMFYAVNLIKSRKLQGAGQINHIVDKKFLKSFGGENPWMIWRKVAECYNGCQGKE